MTYDFSSRAEVVEAVEELAEELWEADYADTIEEARELAWTVEGGALYDAYTSLTPELVTGPEVVQKADRPPTLRDAIYEAVRDRGLIAQMRPGNFSRSIEDLIDEVWSTPEGREVYNLYSGPYGDLPATEALSRIEKSGQHHYDDAINTVRDWLDEY